MRRLQHHLTPEAVTACSLTSALRCSFCSRGMCLHLQRNSITDILEDYLNGHIVVEGFCMFGSAKSDNVMAKKTSLYAMEIFK